MTATSTSKPVPSAVTKKHVSFRTPDDSAENTVNTGDPGGDGLLLHVRGHGQLCIKSASVDGNQNDVDINILVNIHSDKVPITLFLPHEQASTQLEITGDGDIQFAVKESSDVKKPSKPLTSCPSKSELNDLNKECMVVETGQNNEFKKSHRRNNSDFLQVSGKDVHSDSETIDRAPEEISSVKTANNARAFTEIQRNICVETESLQTETPDNKSAEANTGTKEVSTNGEEFENSVPAQECEGQVTSKKTDDSGDKKRASVGKNVSGFSEKPEKSSLSRKFSFSKSLPDTGQSGLSLCEAIRLSFTYLLDALDLLDLCDHLYEKYILDIEVYQKLFHMCFDPRHTRNAKRSLLMHLSTRTVQRDKLIDALYGSAQYQLIPCFYPDIKI